MGDFREIAAVLFDLDGTLYRQPPLRALMALELATLPLSGPLRARRRLIALRAYRAAQESLRGEAGVLEADAQLAEAVRASGLPAVEVGALVNDWMAERPLKYLPLCRARGLTRLLDVLENRRLPAGVLSDYPAKAKLRALGVEGRFSPVLCATDPEIGAFKPSPRGFRRAADIWRVRPDQVLVVGDRPEVDAAGASAAGMRCVIVGRRRPPARPAGADYDVVPSLEALGGVFSR